MSTYEERALRLQVSCLTAEIDRLEAIVAKYPKTADGVTMSPDMQVWQVETRNAGKSWFLKERTVCLDWPFSGWSQRRCYSTREAAEAASGVFFTSSKPTRSGCSTQKVEECSGMNIRLVDESIKQNAKIDKLQEIVAKLPKTADGVPVVPGNRVWETPGDWYSVQMEIRPGPYSLEVPDWLEVYSTREAANEAVAEAAVNAAAEAAKEKA